MSERSLKSNPNGSGRRPLLTKEVQDQYFMALQLGLSQKRSAKRAGVAVNTIKNWLERGESASSMPAGKRTPFEQKCVEFLIAHDKVDNEWIVRCETVLNLCLTPGQSQQKWEGSTIEERRLAGEIARFKLTHQAPGEYSTRTEFTGKDGGPVDLALTNGEDVFKILLEAVAVEEASDE